MATADGQLELQQMQAEKRRVALNSVYAALLITGLKAFVGVRSGSLGILSEAAHSALDLIAAAITLYSVRISDLPADAEHQYGHGKIENFSAFIETGLLLLTCAWIMYEAFHRIFYHSVHIQPSIAAFSVMFASMIVDWWRSRRLKRIASKYDSQALEADALHFSTDVWSSGVVVIGLALVSLSQGLQVPWLRNADPIAALIVAGIIIYVSSRLARQTVDALLDAAPSGIRNRIIEKVAEVDGVLEVDRVRIRRAGNHYFADISIGLARSLTFQRSEQVAAAVSESVQSLLQHCDVVVHSVPREAIQESIFDRIRGVVTRNNMNVHDVSVQDLRGRLHVEQHLELDEKLSLKDAHEVVTRLETEIRSEVPEVDSILTHIESEPNTIESWDEVINDPGLEQRLRGIADEFPEIVDVHEFEIRRVRSLIYLSCHCTLPDSLPLSRVHDISTALEIRFKQEAPQLFKVLIHTEPMTDNRR